MKTCREEENIFLSASNHRGTKMLTLIYVCTHAVILGMLSFWGCCHVYEVSSRAVILASRLKDRCHSLIMGYCVKQELKLTAESGQL